MDEFRDDFRFGNRFWLSFDSERENSDKWALVRI